MTNTPTRIVLADDQDDIRSGFRLVLDSQPDMSVIGEAADGTGALELARRLRPDVVLADIRMPGIDGLELTRLLAGPGVAHPTRVIVVTTFDLDDYVHTALRNGASGFLLKRSGPTLLIEGVRAAMAGDALISPQITVRLLRRLNTPSPPPQSPPSPPSLSAPPSPVTGPGADPLTHREQDIVRLVARGWTNAQIADELFISPGTVKTHIANVQNKLGTANRVGIAAWAWRTGTAVPEP
ncbi:DNA-binding response regulator [Streptosporangium nondiastaticum]|uniref:DNA-binding response regulator n=1 Tax=Streptosporangium nondiastaticum TaxID=35764 RepID=A0A9X7PFB0_9ACTN|nr:response regulator transcription factor [Streptosporangium nondiastaticum]PSJ25717.1 DNA-binding response regulator [Streptosporangium nondiastaticum]